MAHDTLLERERLPGRAVIAFSERRQSNSILWFGIRTVFGFVTINRGRAFGAIGYLNQSLQT